MAVSRKDLLVNVIATVLLGVTFAFLGVYDSDTLSFPDRLIFWTGIMAVGSIATLLAEPWVFHHMLRGQHPLLQLAAIAALISLPITILLAGLNTNFKFVWSLTNWLLQYLGVLVIALVVVAGRYALPRVLATDTGLETEADLQATQLEKFLERLPIKYRGAQVYAVSSEGHYLRVHTDRGEEMILMRLSDALRELENAGGLQVHRSWWVAEDAVADINRKNGKRTLILKSGSSVPVSRSFLPALKKAGLDG